MLLDLEVFYLGHLKNFYTIQYNTTRNRRTFNRRFRFNAITPCMRADALGHCSTSNDVAENSSPANYFVASRELFSSRCWSRHIQLSVIRHRTNSTASLSRCEK